MIKIFCDRCGVEIPNDSEKWLIQWKHGTIPLTREDELIQYEIHLCDCCMKEIEEFIHNKPQISKEREEERDRKSKNAKKRLDHKKIRELKDEGFTNKQIAEMVGSTPGSVAQSLSQRKDIKIQKHDHTKEKGKTIDKEKIMALFVAGWSMEKIADEIGKSLAEVKEVIKNM